jgi:hypothetical protein
MINGILFSKIRQSAISSIGSLAACLVLSNRPSLGDAFIQGETGAFYKVVRDQKYIIGSIDSRVARTDVRC